MNRFEFLHSLGLTDEEIHSRRLERPRKYDPALPAHPTPDYSTTIHDEYPNLRFTTPAPSITLASLTSTSFWAVEYTERNDGPCKHIYWCQQFSLNKDQPYHPAFIREVLDHIRDQMIQMIDQSIFIAQKYGVTPSGAYADGLMGNPSYIPITSFRLIEHPRFHYRPAFKDMTYPEMVESFIKCFDPTGTRETEFDRPSGATEILQVIRHLSDQEERNQVSPDMTKDIKS